jgi:UDP-glucose 4-epimerase
VHTVVVTGAGGYVGGRLVAVLQNRGWEVRCVGREPANWLGVEQIMCDLANGDTARLLPALDGADAVIHLAGESEVVSARDPAGALAATTAATESVAEACASMRVRRLVYMSTVHVYGDRMVPGATLTEDLRPEPRSAYAISRLASEHIAASRASDRYDLVAFRLTNSIGAPQHPSVDRWSLVANDLCRQGAVLGHLELRSSGMQWRDFVPLSAVCEAVAVAAASDSPLLPGTYNLGSGRPITVRHLAALIQDEFERQTAVRPELHAPEPEPDPPAAYHVSVDSAARYGIQPASGVEDAIEETVRFCLAQKRVLS